MTLSKEEQEKKALEFQILNNQFEQYQQQLAKLQTQKQDTSTLLESLQALSNLKQNSEFLSPLRSGVLVKTSLKDPNQVFMAVGAGVIVKKPINEAKELLQEREKQLLLMLSQLQSQIQNLGKAINSLHQELQTT